MARGHDDIMPGLIDIFNATCVTKYQEIEHDVNAVTDVTI